MTAPTTIVDLADKWELALPDVSDEDRHLARTAVRLLAEGRPVEAERLSGALGRPVLEVADRLSQLFAVYRDDRERVIGIWGLFLIETPHRLLVDGRQLYAGCAGDALFLPFVLDRRTHVESTDPTNGERITMVVSPDGVSDLAPTGAATSLMIPTKEGIGSDDPRGNVCANHHFFGSKDAAQAWTAEHSGVVPLSIEDGFTISRWWAARLFGIGDAHALDPRVWAQRERRTTMTRN